ncbi:uncharacterized protein [Ptychodera flava]|uniref:uncharacterized protein isoform X2 n=1 Tax=Ptychodera flava TaxID=63121 RepID=UPI003969DA7A
MMAQAGYSTEEQRQLVKDGNSPARSLYRNLLMVAIDAGQIDAAKYLIEAGINVQHKMWVLGGKKSARDFAKERGLEDIVPLIDEKLPSTQQLFHYVSEGNTDIVKKLINDGVDINITVDPYGDPLSGCAGYTLLMIAIKNDQSAVAMQLLKKDVNVVFEHQEWDRPDSDSDPILVESVTARQLAEENGMFDVMTMIDELTPSIETKKQQIKRSKYGHENTDDVTTNSDDDKHNNCVKSSANLEENAYLETKSQGKSTQTATKKDDSSCTCVLL